MNGFALTFYEKVKDYEICKAMQILQDMFLAELASRSTKTRSHSAVLFREHMEGFQRHSFSSSTPEIKLYDSEKHNLLVSKCLCLVMPLPFTSAAKTCLSKIYQGGLAEEGLSLALECYLFNLIYEVPLPPPGKKLKFTCITEEVLCQRPGLNELPLFDYSLEDVLALVGVKDFLKLLSCVMLEHQILILGSGKYDSYFCFRVFFVARSCFRVCACAFLFACLCLRVPVSVFVLARSCFRVCVCAFLFPCLCLRVPVSVFVFARSCFRVCVCAFLFPCLCLRVPVSVFVLARSCFRVCVCAFLLPCLCLRVPVSVFVCAFLFSCLCLRVPVFVFVFARSCFRVCVFVFLFSCLC